MHVEVLSTPVALAKAGLRFALGRCLSTEYFDSARVRRYVENVVNRQ